MKEWELGSYSDKQILETLVSENKHLSFYNTARQTPSYKALKKESKRKKKF